MKVQPVVHDVIHVQLLPAALAENHGRFVALGRVVVTRSAGSVVDADGLGHAAKYAHTHNRAQAKIDMDMSKGASALYLWDPAQITCGSDVAELPSATNVVE